MYINPVSLMWRYWIFIFLGKCNSKKGLGWFLRTSIKKGLPFLRKSFKKLCILIVYYTKY